MLDGGFSALPGPAGVTAGVVYAVICEGAEEQLGDCQVGRQDATAIFPDGRADAALVCASPSSAALVTLDMLTPKTPP